MANSTVIIYSFFTDTLQYHFRLGEDFFFIFPFLFVLLVNLNIYFVSCGVPDLECICVQYTYDIISSWVGVGDLQAYQYLYY